MTTLLESLQGSLRRVARHNPNNAVQHAAMLWTEPDGQWQVAGLELFDKAETMSKTLEKLVGSFTLDALEEAERSEGPGEPGITAFLARIKKAHVTAHPAVDLGTDLHLSGDRLVGGALVMDGRVVHLSAFNLEEPEEQEDFKELIA